MFCASRSRASQGDGDSRTQDIESLLTDVQTIQSPVIIQSKNENSTEMEESIRGLPRVRRSKLVNLYL